MESNTNQPLVSVLTLTWNSEDSIERCLRGVARQTYPHLEIITTDNNSHDRTREIIERLKSIFTGSRSLTPDWRSENSGYGEGRNSGIRLARGKYVLCLNDDVALEDDFIEQAVLTLERDEKIGAVQGKLIQSQKSKVKSQNFNSKIKTDQNKEVIDTTGLAAYKSRRFANRGHGEEDRGQYEKEEEVFGVDGAAPVYRRAALEDIKILTKSYKLHQAEGLALSDGAARKLDEFSGGRRSKATEEERRRLKAKSYEYFDPDFFLYKEDIDLSWRLRLAGWKIAYQPKARGTNARTSKTGMNFLEARFQTPRRVRYFSFRNYHFLLLKNEGGWFFIAHLPWILARECGYVAMSLLFELGNIVAVEDIIRLLPRMLRKRRVIMENRRVSWGEVYRWFK